MPIKTMFIRPRVFFRHPVNGRTAFFAYKDNDADQPLDPPLMSLLRPGCSGDTDEDYCTVDLSKTQIWKPYSRSVTENLHELLLSDEYFSLLFDGEFCPCCNSNAILKTKKQDLVFMRCSQCKTKWPITENKSGGGFFD